MMKRTRKQLSLALLMSGVLSGFFAISGAASGDLFACTTSRDADNDILVDFTELQVTLPASWAGKCKITKGTSTASFYHIQSNTLRKQNDNIDGGGLLFYLCCSEDPDFDHPSYDFIGDTVSGSYYVCYPTDVQAYTEDAAAAGEYASMATDIDWIVSSIALKPDYAYYSDSSDSIGTDDEYILPQSSSVCLTKEDLSGLSANEIQMAINEIYARHHRKFVLQEVQNYFNEKSWYEGSVEAADFDTGVLNSCEGQNINLMVTYMKDNGLSSTIGIANSSASGAASSQTSADKAEVYGTIITKTGSYFRLQQPDGTVIQFWYDTNRMTESALQAGLTVTVTYDTDGYEALDITVW